MHPQAAMKFDDGRHEKRKRRFYPVQRSGKGFNIGLRMRMSKEVFGEWMEKVLAKERPTLV